MTTTPDNPGDEVGSVQIHIIISQRINGYVYECHKDISIKSWQATRAPGWLAARVIDDAIAEVSRQIVQHIKDHP